MANKKMPVPPVKKKMPPKKVMPPKGGPKSQAQGIMTQMLDDKENC